MLPRDIVRAHTALPRALAGHEVFEDGTYNQNLETLTKETASEKSDGLPQTAIRFLRKGFSRHGLRTTATSGGHRDITFILYQYWSWWLSS